MGWDGDVELVWFALGLAVIVALTLVLQRWARLGLGSGPAVAAVRAVVQLSVIAVLLRGVLSVPWTVVLFVVLMASTA